MLIDTKMLQLVPTSQALISAEYSFDIENARISLLLIISFM